MLGLQTSSFKVYIGSFFAIVVFSVVVTLLAVAPVHAQIVNPGSCPTMSPTGIECTGSNKWCNNTCQLEPSVSSPYTKVNCGTCQPSCATTQAFCSSNTSCQTKIQSTCDATYQQSVCNPGSTTTQICGACKSGYQDCDAGAAYNCKTLSNSCTEGQIWDPCSATCTDPYVKAFTAGTGPGSTPQAADANIGGDLNIASGKAIRVDTTIGDSELNIGNWGGTGRVKVRVHGNTVADDYCWNNGASCISQGAGGRWTKTGFDIYYNTGNVGIGTTTPNAKLHVPKYIDFGNPSSSTYLGRWAGGPDHGPNDSNNTAVGVFAGYSMNNGQAYSNTLLGYRAGYTNTTGDNNVMIGIDAGALKNLGTMNIGVGYFAYNNPASTYSYNIALGGNAMRDAQGSYAIALGYYAGRYAENYSISLGRYSGHGRTAGYGPVYGINVGYHAGQYDDNNYNVHLGTFAGRGSSTYGTGYMNVALGYGALNAAYDGAYNVGLSRNALYGLTTGTGNIGIGYYAGYRSGGIVSTGSYNTFLGYNTGFTSLTQFSRATAIGYGATVGCSDCISLGSADKVGIYTSTPAYPLDVAGTAQMTGFKMPTGAGTNKVLTSDVSGVGTWQNPPAPPAETDTLANVVARGNMTTAPIGLGAAPYGTTGNPYYAQLTIQNLNLQTSGAQTGWAYAYGTKMDLRGSHTAPGTQNLHGYHTSLSNTGGTVRAYHAYFNDSARIPATVYGFSAYFTPYTAASPNKIGVYVSGEDRNYFSGNVGIGASNPTEKLQVSGTVKATAFVGDGSGLTGISTPSETDPQVGANTTNYVPKWNGSALVKGSMYDNGNVGLGTTAPVAALTINEAPVNIFGHTPANAGLLFETTYSGDLFTPGVYWRTTNANPNEFTGGIWMQMGPNTGTAKGYDMVFEATTDPVNGITDNGKMRLTRGGNLYVSGKMLVGTSIYDSTSSKLKVNGTAEATAFIGDGSGLTNLPIPSIPTVSGTSGYVPKFTGTTSIGNSLMYSGSYGVAINTTTQRGQLNVHRSTNYGQLYVGSNNNSSNGFVGLVYFYGKDSGGAVQDYAGIGSRATNTTSGSESGDLSFRTYNSGSWGERMVLSSDGRLSLGGYGTTERLYVPGNIQIGANDSTDKILAFGYTPSGSNSVRVGSSYPADIRWDPGTGKISIFSDSTLRMNFNTAVLTERFYVNRYGVAAAGGFGAGGQAPTSGYGIYSKGTTMGGRFEDSTNASPQSRTYVGYHTYGIYVSVGSAYKPGGGAWLATSDRRTKKDVSPFSDGLEVLKQIDPVNYTYNGLGDTPEGMQAVGVIAQDIADVAPYMVSTTKRKLHEGDAEETDIMIFDPSALPFINMNAIKEQQAMIGGLESEILDLRERIDALEALMSR